MTHRHFLRENDVGIGGLKDPGLRPEILQARGGRKVSAE